MVTVWSYGGGVQTAGIAVLVVEGILPRPDYTLMADTSTLTTTASRYVPIPSLAVTSGIEFLKLVCGTAQSTTDTVFTLAVRPV
jgi:hypothetical protein